MAIPDHDGNMRSDLETHSNLSTIGFIAAVFIVGLVMVLMMIPRAGTPTSATSNPTTSPMTTPIPRDTPPVIPSTTPKQP